MAGLRVYDRSASMAELTVEEHATVGGRAAKGLGHRLFAEGPGDEAHARKVGDVGRVFAGSEALGFDFCLGLCDGCEFCGGVWFPSLEHGRLRVWQ